MSFWKKKTIIPRTWDEIKLGQMVDAQDDVLLGACKSDYFEEPTEIERLVYQIACLTNVPIAAIMEMKHSDFKNLTAVLSFTADLPAPVKRISSVRVRGTKYSIADPLKDDQLAKYVTYERLEREEDLIKAIAENDFAAFLRLLSIVCHEAGTKYVDDEVRIAERARDLREISIPQALGLLDFFLFHFNSYATNSIYFGKSKTRILAQPNDDTLTAGDGSPSPTTAPELTRKSGTPSLNKASGLSSKR